VGGASRAGESRVACFAARPFVRPGSAFVPFARLCLLARLSVLPFAFRAPDGFACSEARSFAGRAFFAAELGGFEAPGVAAGFEAVGVAADFAATRGFVSRSATRPAT
jgi:hypothetical protein